jgi:hypothetical protein
MVQILSDRKSGVLTEAGLLRAALNLGFGAVPQLLLQKQDAGLLE